MPWLILIVAGLFETAFAFCIGKSNETIGKTSAYWFIGFLACLAISMTLLLKATKSIPLGTAYAVWTGIGAVGTVIVGILFFKEPATFWRIFFIFTLIFSIIGLKYVAH
jgi:quaternary ammonium compound-resistance protein SugE